MNAWWNSAHWSRCRIEFCQFKPVKTHPQCELFYNISPPVTFTGGRIFTANRCFVVVRVLLLATKGVLKAHMQHSHTLLQLVVAPMRSAFVWNGYPRVWYMVTPSPRCPLSATAWPLLIPVPTLGNKRRQAANESRARWSRVVSADAACASSYLKHKRKPSMVEAEEWSVGWPSSVLVRGVFNFCGVFQAHWERSELRRIPALFSKRCFSHYAPQLLWIRTQIIGDSFCCPLIQTERRMLACKVFGHACRKKICIFPLIKWLAAALAGPQTAFCTLP